eukprot:PhF_6_TR3991/c0_g1_i1/m.5519/K16904/DCTPP1; dCTP diphosphatase
MQRDTSTVTLTDIRDAQRTICSERNWGKHHTPRNLVLSTMSEVGELSRILQWQHSLDAEGTTTLSSDDVDSISEELADILLNVVRLADVCGIDPSRATIERLNDLNHRNPP